MKSTIGKVSAIMVLLTFILASAFVLNVALAQNETNALENVTVNETVDNGTASWDFVEGISLNETVENVTIVPNETSNETSLSNFTNSTNVTGSENVTNETVSNETIGLNITLNETELNETNQTDLNVSLNETNVTVDNETLNETNTTSNETEENENLDENEIIGPVIEPVVPTFDVKLSYPQKITRGEDIGIRADLTSDSFAKSVYMKWILPDGFEIISGNSVETCGDLDENISCSSEIDVRTNLSVLGLSEIKVVVSYEK